MPKKGGSYVTMTEKIRKDLCNKKIKEPWLSHRELISWLEVEHGIKVTQGTISNTLRRSAALVDKDENNAKLSGKRQKNVHYPMMEQALAEWFVAHQEKSTMNGDFIKDKGQRFLDALYPDHETFVFSNGWLESFKVRHNIKSFRRLGESGSVDMDLIAQSLPQIRKKLDAYELKDIYNMDETGLFYRMQGDHSLATKQLGGRKQSKERLSTVICCNADCSDKLPLWIIGKHYKSGCFKDINLGNIDFHWNANKKAWMTSFIFEKWIKWLDKRMQTKGKTFLLIMDNCSSHIAIENLPVLSNVEVFYLPPNTTSKIQPCDAGIIRTFKCHYRIRFHCRFLDALEKGEEEPAKIDVLEAILMSIEAWKMVKMETIANSFKHCNYRSLPNAEVPVEENCSVESAVLEEVAEQLCELGRKLHYQNPMDIRNLLNYAEEGNAHYVPEDNEIINSVRETNHISAQCPVNEHVDDQDDSEEVL